MSRPRLTYSMLSGDDLVDTVPIPEFPPHVLREYAFLADGERGILVGPRGDLAWMCFPHWDSAAIFSSLIGGSGVYAITPKERSVWGGFYEEGSLIWHGRWVTDSRSVIECREALALPSERDRAVLLRHVTALEGTARVQMILNPRGDFGQAPFRNLHLDERGVWSGQVDEIEVHLSGAAEATPRPDGHKGNALVLDFELAEGTNRDFVLTIGQRQLERPTPDSDVAWSETEAAWQERVPQFTDIYARRDARHAYALLSGLTSQSGGMVAAATMSLPERATEGRNYDYRYVWIRDQCYAGQAVAATGAHPLLDSAVKFVSERLLEHGPGLKPVYRTSGESTPGERHLGLPGYPGGDDIVGNNARNQFQLDAFGESLLLLAAAARHDRLEPDSWRAATIAARAIEERWREPDAGIWELEPDEWTHSRLICAAGLRAISAHAPENGSWTGSHSPIGSPQTRARAASTPPAAGSAHPATRASTPRCSYPRYAKRFRRTIHALWPPSGHSPSSSPKTATPTVISPMNAHSAKPREPSSSAASSSHARISNRGQRDRIGAVVRAHPECLRTARASRRGVRRHPISAARELAPSLRPCLAARVRSRPTHDTGSAIAHRARGTLPASGGDTVIPPVSERKGLCCPARM